LCTILPAITYLHTHKNSRFVTISVAVIEFGDISLAQRFAEIFISARTLGNSDCQNRFALLADFGALRDVTQTVKIDIGTAVDGNKRLASAAGLGHIFF